MVYFLDDNFNPNYPEIVSNIKSEDYYVNMMIAWYFATALFKQWDAIFTYLSEKHLTPFVHKKTIQKAIESYRITPDQKNILKGFILFIKANLTGRYILVQTTQPKYTSTV